MTDAVLTHQINENYSIRIFRDECYKNPASEWDGESKVWWFGSWGRNYYCSEEDRSGSNRRSISADYSDVLQSLVLEHITAEQLKKYIADSSDMRFTYNRHRNSWDFELYQTHFGKQEWCDVDYFSPYEYHNEDSYLVEHISEHLTTEDYESLLQSCPTIAIRIGHLGGCYGSDLHHSIVLTDMEVRKVCWGKDAEWDKEWAERHVDGCVETQNRYINNEVYGYRLERRILEHTTRTFPGENKPFMHYDSEDWDEIDSCWNYYMDPEELVQEVLSQYQELTA